VYDGVVLVVSSMTIVACRLRVVAYMLEGMINSSLRVVAIVRVVSIAADTLTGPRQPTSCL